MISFKAAVLTLGGMLIFSSALLAAPSAEVSHGKPARENVVNARFSALEDRLRELEAGLMNHEAIDCIHDQNALVNTTLRSKTIYTLSGMCNGPIWIDNKHDIIIQGDGGDDGVILPLGLPEHPVGAVAVWKSVAIKIDNLTLSASNYINQSYAFGDNVASLSATDNSYIEAANVNFIGGDFSVDISNGAQLSLHRNVTVTDYNRAGLSANNHALINAHDAINISGLVGLSTETYPYALVAIGNSVIDIRQGGTFSGASGQAIDEYATAVWSGDNSTIRFRNGAMASSVNGAIESAYSSMVRIEGNLVLNGALAAYHRGYIRAAGVTQAGGPLYAGDAATIRTEGGSLAPSSIVYPTAPAEVYRQGNLRMNNTIFNLNGNPLHVSGFGVLNLRGSTNLGNSDIFCHDANQISIRPSVNHTGSVSCIP